MSPIKVKLKIAVDAGHVRAFLRFENRSESPVQLLRNITFLAGPPGRKLFRLRGVEGEKVPFIGKMVKRGTWQPNDFLTIDSGESIESTTDLESDYQFPHDRVLCMAMYDAVNPSIGKQELFELRSNKVEFECHGVAIRSSED